MGTKHTDFKIGDRVNHTRMGDGSVTEIADGGAVVVTFDAKYRRRDGTSHPSIGKYDASWFDLYQDCLTHLKAEEG